MKRIFTHANDERGIALVMALGMLLMLAIVGATFAVYSVSNTHQATYSASKQSAYCSPSPASTTRCRCSPTAAPRPPRRCSATTAAPL
jgi:hypothetical protein